MHFYLMEYLKDENSKLVMNVSSKHADIIKRYDDGTYLDLFVIESQSYVDQSMVARVIIRQNFKKHGTHAYKTSNDFNSRPICG